MLSERRSCSWSLMLPDVESDGARTGPELKLDVVLSFQERPPFSARKPLNLTVREAMFRHTTHIISSRDVLESSDYSQQSMVRVWLVLMLLLYYDTFWHMLK